jgi:hypothetical protein
VAAGPAAATAERPKPPNEQVRTLEAPGAPKGERPLRVSYEADVFEPPRRVSSPPPGKETRATVLEAYSAAFAANRAGDVEAIAGVFAPTERDGVKARIDADSLERNKQFFDSIVEEQVLEVIHYGEFRVCVVRSVMGDGQSVMRDMPFVQIDGQWWATNRLATDKSFNFVLEGIKEAYRE